MSDRHLLLVDASAIAYQAYHSAAPGYREEDGEPIGAVLRYMQIMWRLLGAAQHDKPTHGAAIFDAPGKNFRHDLCPDYKANRPPARNLELRQQLVYMRHASEALGLKPLEKARYEADDLIATLATRARAVGIFTTIVSPDKDFGQLVDDKWIQIYNLRQRKRMLAADIEEKMGVPPHMVPHLQALWGDAVDNIIGVDGVGKDKAGRLVRRYGDIEKVLAAANEIRWAPIRLQLKKPKVAAQVRLNLKLATLRRDVKMNVGMDELLLQPVMRQHLEAILKSLGATHRMEEVFALDPKMTRLVPHQENPEAWWDEELKWPGQKLPELPQAGYYERRLGLDKPFVACRIWVVAETDEAGAPTGMDIMRCSVGGTPRDPLAEWTRLSMGPITREKYDFMVADAAHAKKWRPGDPKSEPHKKIDLLKQPAPHNPNPLRRKTS